MSDDKGRKLAATEKATKMLKDAADACREHTRSCWICRWRVVNFFLRCQTVENLLYVHMVAKLHADKHRGTEELPAPSVDWLENLYRL